MFEGIPTYPTASRCWEICDKYDITIFYTAPTAIRALMAQGDDAVEITKRDSLRILGTVGEPINPEAWDWYYRVVGKSRCEVIDTWWPPSINNFTPRFSNNSIVPVPCFWVNWFTNSSKYSQAISFGYFYSIISLCH